MSCDRCVPSHIRFTAVLMFIAGLACGYGLLPRAAHADSPEDRYLERIARAVEKIADRADRCK